MDLWSVTDSKEPTVYLQVGVHQYYEKRRAAIYSALVCDHLGDDDCTAILTYTRGQLNNQYLFCCLSYSQLPNAHARNHHGFPKRHSCGDR